MSGLTSATIESLPEVRGQRSEIRDLIGASGFVFLDERPWPYLVSEISGDWWLYYWAHSQKNFVTLRQLVPAEVERFRPLALPPEQAGFYCARAALRSS
jgi:hypothetical protein